VPYQPAASPRPTPGAPSASQVTPSATPTRAAVTGAPPTPPPAAEIPKRGYVVHVDTTRIAIDLTAADGLRPGTVVSIRRDKTPIVHPVTGEKLGELDEEVATAKVVERRSILLRESGVSAGSRSRFATGRPRGSAARVPTPALDRSSRARGRPGGRRLAFGREAIRGELDSSVALIRRWAVHAGAGGKRLRPMLLSSPPDWRGPRTSVRALACVVRLLHARRSSTMTWSIERRCDALRPAPAGATMRPSWSGTTSTQVVRHAGARQRLGGDGNAGPGHGVDDRGRGVPAGAQAERGPRRGRLYPHHHPEDGVLHLRLLPNRRTPRGRRGPSGGGAHPLRAGRRGRFQISTMRSDFMADQTRLGEAVGADLRQGKRTPLISMLQRSTDAERGAAWTLLRRAPCARMVEESGSWWSSMRGQYAGARAGIRLPSDLEGLSPSEERESGAHRGLRRRPRPLTPPRPRVPAIITLTTD
jgi:hypothetical protein